MIQIALFCLFIVAVLFAIRWDLNSNKGLELTIKQASLRTIMWFAIGLGFSILLFFFYHHFHQFYHINQFLNYKVTYQSQFQIVTHGDIQQTINNFNKNAAVLFLSGFFIEYALSMDNLFVILLIFQSYKVSPTNQRKLLSYGIWGAIIMRFIFIFAGSALVSQFHFILYIFAIFLIYSGFKIMLQKEEDENFDPQSSKLVKFASKLVKINHQAPATKLWYRSNGALFFTPLFLILLVVEFSDVIFAVDSVPAIFGITTDAYLVFFANIFAIIGLRSLFFVLGASINKFYALQYGLSLVLIFIGCKMLFQHWFHQIGFNHMHNLLTLITILGGSIAFSLIFPKPNSSNN